MPPNAGKTFTPKKRLHHEIPSWVCDGSTFHIRIRASDTFAKTLTAPDLSEALLRSARIYHQSARWYCHLFLLMPDHLHALLSFPPEKAMRDVIGRWKQFHARENKIEWQENFFDHRIRNDAEFDLKETYIRQNPVVKELCFRMEDWSHVIDVRDLCDA